jgi:ADP-ribose pyrophosphatase YjhB (NUDIX family)
MVTEVGMRPKAAVSACLFRGDEVVLVRRGKPPYLGRWSLPGGSIEAGETSKAAVVREIREETGLAFEPLGVAGVNDVIVRDERGIITHHYVIIVFAGSVAPGCLATAGDDAAEVGFFHLGALDGLERDGMGVGRRQRDLIDRARVMAQQVN